METVATAIDPKELCVGSYVYASLPNPNTIAQVTSIGYSTIGLTLIDSRKLYNEWPMYLKPVPLTGEWLEKLGYNRRNEGTYLCWRRKEGFTRISTHFQDGAWLWFIWIMEDAIQVKSIHHLQALVWNIEGVWLTITEKEVNRG